MLGFGPSLSEHCEARAEPHIDPMNSSDLASILRGKKQDSHRSPSPFNPFADHVAQRPDLIATRYK
jgi:hypothetical protein